MGAQVTIQTWHRQWLVGKATFAQTALLSFTSTLTSFVLMCFVANFLISLMALGARFLKEISLRRLCRLMVYSRVTTSLEWSFFTICAVHRNISHTERTAPAQTSAVSPLQTHIRRSCSSCLYMACVEMQKGAMNIHSCTTSGTPIVLQCLEPGEGCIGQGLLNAVRCSSEASKLCVPCQMLVKPQKLAAC